MENSEKEEVKPTIEKINIDRNTFKKTDDEKKRLKAAKKMHKASLK